MASTNQPRELKLPWVRQELVLVPMAAEDAADAITQLGQQLQAGGFVKNSWIQATIEREKTFATGLPTPEIQVAIPHTDIEHVLQQAIAVGVLDEPVPFGEMGNPEQSVMAQIICALAVTKSEQLVELLQRLVTMFQNPVILKEIVKAGDRARIANIVNEQLETS